MTATFGPLDDDHERDSGVTSWLADTTIVGTVRLYTYFLDGSVRYDSEQKRLSLHGESEHAGEGFAVGTVTTTVTVSAALLSMLPVVVVGELGPVVADSTGSQLVAALTLAGIGFLTIKIMGEIIDRTSNIEVYDHRTAPHDDERLGELQAAYARGDIDREAFESEVEAVVEREAER